MLRQLVVDYFIYRRWSAAIVIAPAISRTVYVDLIAQWVAAPIKCAPMGTCDDYPKWGRGIARLGRKMGWAVYTQLVSISQSQMELVSNAIFSSGLAGHPIIPAIPDIRMLRRENSFALRALYVVVVPGAGNLSRSWPIDNFVAVCREIPPSIGVVVCGSESEKSLNDVLVQTLQSYGRDVVDLTGKTDLMGMISVVAGAALVLGNDSSAMHMAAGLNVPSVIIAGGGHAGRFVPYCLARTPLCQ